MGTRVLLLAAFVFIMPAAAFAQVSTTQTHASPQGGVLILSDTVIDAFQNFSTAINDVLNNSGGQITNPQFYNDSNFGLAIPSAYGSGAVNRLCNDVDAAFGPNPNAVASSADDRTFTGGGDVLNWNGSDWFFMNNTAHHVQNISCTSYALPAQSLSLSTYQISAGASATLSWADTARRDTIWPADPTGGGLYSSPNGPVTQCTVTSDNPESSFTIPTSDDASAAVCTQWTSVKGTGPGCGNLDFNDGSIVNDVAAVILGVNSCPPPTLECVNQVGRSAATTYDAPDTGSGSITVSPTQTTTYTYSCTNPNGTTVQSATLTVAQGGTPDLTATSSPAWSGFLPGESVNYTQTVANIGAASTGQSFPVLFQSATDAAGDGAADIGTANAPALAAGAFESISFAYTTTNASFYIRACANKAVGNQPPGPPNGSVTEGSSEYGNNCGAWGLVSEQAADLTSSSLTPTSAPAATPDPFTTTITNGGNLATEHAFPVLFQSASDAVGNGAANLGTTNAATLGSGASEPVSYTYTPTASGTIYLRACANTLDNQTFSVTESNYANNCGAWTAITVVPPTSPQTLAASCSVSPSSGTTNDTYTWSASATGGTGGYTYRWSGDGPLAGKTGQSVSIDDYSCAAGTCSYSGAVTVTDSSGNSAGPASCATTPGSGAPGAPGTPPGAGVATVSAVPVITSFSATPTTVDCGSATGLTWQTSDAASCTASGDWSGTKAADNSTGASVVPSTAPATNYGLTCYSAAGIASAPVSLAVQVTSPYVTITATPARVSAGGSTSVLWSAHNVASCTVAANGATIAHGSANGSGDYTNSAAPYSASPGVQTVYTISCQVPGSLPAACSNNGSTNASATVNVVQNFFSF